MRAAAISPDGGTVAFSYRGDLWSVAATGGTATPLTVHAAYDTAPVWSPDGRSLGFFAGGSLKRIDLGGGGVQILRRLGEEAVIPEELLVAMEDGVREGALSGVLAGYPVIDIRIILLGGSQKEGETTPLGCKIAASSAFREG